MNMIYTCLTLLLLISCGGEDTTTTDLTTIQPSEELQPSEATQSSEEMKQEDLAKITAVECTGQPNNYTLSVTIASPDTGCDQYADWWEVFYPDSTLIYRRILGHSHVTEQPFTRSGGLVPVGADEFIYVRAHMNNLGYGTQVFSGNVREGLVLDSLATSYASGLATEEPLPTSCAF